MTYGHPTTGCPVIASTLAMATFDIDCLVLLGSVRLLRGGMVPLTKFFCGSSNGSPPVLCSNVCLTELANLNLACDCAVHDFCDGDVLVGAFAQQRVPPINLSRRRKSHGKLMLGIMAGLKIPAAVASHVAQATVVISVTNLLPGVCWDGVRWPLVEDLVNHHAIQAFPTWIQENMQNLEDGELGPQILGRSGVMLQRAASQAQSGAAARKTAIAPLVPFGLSPDEHFAAASFCQVSGSRLTSGTHRWTRTSTLMHQSRLKDQSLSVNSDLLA